MAFNDLHCPFCLGKLNLLSDSKSLLRCRHCERDYPIVNGIPILCKNTDYFYGEISRNETKSLLKAIQESNDWQKGFSEYLNSLSAAEADYLIKYILDNRRAGLKFLLSLDTSYRALDLGCGWGTFSMSIGEHVGHVYAMDLTLERLLFLKQWTLFKNLDNVGLVCGGDTPYLPYPDNYFDIVVLNGVLEWIPKSVDGDPLSIQINFLTEVRRILKSSGQVYLGIENRYNYQYFLGKADDHSGLLFGSILPRRIANLYSCLKKRESYRTYTHSYNKYLSILRKAGFRQIRTFASLPSYRYPKSCKEITTCKANGKSIELRYNGGTSICSKLCQNIKSKVKASKIFPHIVPSFIFVAKPETNHMTFAEGILSEAFPRCVAELWNYRITQTGVLCVFASCRCNSHVTQIVLKIPLSPQGQNRLDKNFTNIYQMRNNYADIANKVPKALCKGVFKGQNYYVEEFVSGICGEELFANHGLSLIRNGALFIRDLHKLTMSHHTSDQMVLGLDRMHQELTRFRPIGYDFHIIAKAHKLLRNYILQEKLPAVFGHNDYYLGNIIFDKSGSSIRGVLDWDLANTVSFPMIDLFHLLARSYKSQLGGSLPLAIANTLISDNPCFRRTIEEYCKDLNLPVENKNVYILLYCYFLLWRNIYRIGDLGEKGIYYRSINKENESIIRIMKDLLPHGQA